MGLPFLWNKPSNGDWQTASCQHHPTLVFPPIGWLDNHIIMKAPLMETTSPTQYINPPTHVLHVQAQTLRISTPLISHLPSHTNYGKPKKLWKTVNLCFYINQKVAEEFKSFVPHASLYTWQIKICHMSI